MSKLHRYGITYIHTVCLAPFGGKAYIYRLKKKKILHVCTYRTLHVRRRTHLQIYMLGVEYATVQTCISSEYGTVLAAPLVLSFG